jgi:hypothetical protein
MDFVAFYLFMRSTRCRELCVFRLTRLRRQVKQPARERRLTDPLPSSVDLASGESDAPLSMLLDNLGCCRLLVQGPGRSTILRTRKANSGGGQRGDINKVCITGDPWLHGLPARAGAVFRAYRVDFEG